MAFLKKRCNIWNVFSENACIGTLHFCHAVQRWKESAPEHMSSVLPITDGLESTISLHLDAFVDTLIFELM